MDIAKSETFKNFIILNKALLFLIKELDKFNNELQLESTQQLLAINCLLVNFSSSAVQKM